MDKQKTAELHDPARYFAPRNHCLGFAKRTKKNLEFISGASPLGSASSGPNACEVHVVTQIVNFLLGLVVFPWEQHFARSAGRLSRAQLTRQGWPKWETSIAESYSLGHLLHHLRNGISHSHVEFSSDSRLPEEVTITVEDRNPDTEDLVWRGEIRADQLREFCYRFFDLVDQRMG